MIRLNSADRDGQVAAGVDTGEFFLEEVAVVEAGQFVVEAEVLDAVEALNLFGGVAEGDDGTYDLAVAVEDRDALSPIGTSRPLRVMRSVRLASVVGRSRICSM